MARFTGVDFHELDSLLIRSLAEPVRVRVRKEIT